MRKFFIVTIIVLSIISCKQSANVTPPADTSRPTVTFTAAPQSIHKGESSTLSWSVSNANSIAIDNGIGAVAPTGTKTVSPIATTAYTITASNNNGSSTATAIVAVPLVPPVIQYFHATPSTLNEFPFGTAELSWAVTGATMVTINEIGNVAASGTCNVSPSITTTYHMTATNTDGAATASALVTVLYSDHLVFGSYQKLYKSYGSCYILGTVRNVGANTIYNVGINFSAYNNATIIDTAHGFPADLANIPAGVEASFEAIFFDTKDWALITKITYTISWLNSTGQRQSISGEIH